MAALSELGRIAKSAIGHAGKHVPITEMNSRQIAQLRSRVANSREARRRGKGRTFGTRSIRAGTDRTLHGAMEQQQAMARAIPGGMPGPSYRGGVESVSPSKYPEPIRSMLQPPPEGSGDKVRRFRREMGMRRNIQVTGPQKGMPEVAAAAAAPGSRKHGIVAFSSSTASPPDNFVAHELGHLSPKRRTMYRMAQITRSPRKAAREEARADAVAARLAPRSAARTPTAYQQWGRSQEAADTARRSSGRALDRSDTHFSAQSPVPFSPMQARQYRMVRRRTGTWE